MTRRHLARHIAADEPSEDGETKSVPRSLPSRGINGDLGPPLPTAYVHERRNLTNEAREMLTKSTESARQKLDLVELLRNDDFGCSEECLCERAASEIERLRGLLSDKEYIRILAREFAPIAETIEDERCCADCKFRFFPTSECHRHPPVLVDGKWIWPEIDDINDNWCGEFQRFAYTQPIEGEPTPELEKWAGDAIDADRAHEIVELRAAIEFYEHATCLRAPGRPAHEDDDDDSVKGYARRI